MATRRLDVWVRCEGGGFLICPPGVVDACLIKVAGGLYLLYLGDVIICTRDRVAYPDITVEQGIRVFLTGGMALAGRLRARRGDDRVGDFRV